MKHKTPTSAETLTGVVITTAEAMGTLKTIMSFPVVDLKEIHDDVSQLPDRNR